MMLHSFKYNLPLWVKNNLTKLCWSYPSGDRGDLGLHSQITVMCNVVTIDWSCAPRSGPGAVAVETTLTSNVPMSGWGKN